MSGAAQAIHENWEILKTADILEVSLKDKLEKLVDPMQKTLTNLDCKEKSSIATNHDVYHAMRWCFNYPDLDASLSASMQQSAAFLCC